MKNIFIVFFILMGNYCSSQVITWTGGGSDVLWNNSSNWDLAIIPTLSNDVIIPTGFTVDVDGPADARSVNVANGSTVTINSFIEIGMDVTVDTAIVNHGTIDNTDGYINIEMVKSGIRNIENGIVKLGGIGIYNFTEVAIDNYGTFQSTDNSNLEILGGQCVKNSGSFTIGEGNLSSGSADLCIYNSGSIKVDSCASLLITGYIEQVASATFINDGYIYTDMTAASINSGSFVNNGIVSDQYNNLEPIININNGWSVTTKIGTYCSLDTVTSFFGGSGSDLTVIGGELYLSDFFTLAGNFDPITNILTFLPEAVGNDFFIMNISDDDDTGCIYNPKIFFENPISSPDVYFADADGDMFGDPLVTKEACSLPTGYTTDFDDCDDTNDQVYPGAPELCDGLDNDCNLIIDDEAVTTYNNFLDTDNDKDWFNANNWSLGVVPYSCHNVIIDAGKMVEINASSNNAVANSILINNGAVLEHISGSLVIHVGNTYGIRNEGLLKVYGGLELTGIGETAIQTTVASVTIFKTGVSFICYDVGGEVFHNQGVFTIENGVILDFANSFGIGSDLILNENSFQNYGYIIFPFIDNSNGILLNSGTFFNNMSGKLEMAENHVRYNGGLLNNSGQICASNGPYSCP